MTDPNHDPIAQMEAAQEGLRQLFAQWRTAARSAAAFEQQKALGEQICMELAIVTRLEEELLYPLARQALRQAEPLDQALEEHATARELMRPVLRAQQGGADYERRVEALCQCAEVHMAHEGATLYPQLRACGADLALLGRRLRERRRELESVKEALREDALVSASA